MKDLCYEVTTSEVKRCKFLPTPEVLHSHDVREGTNRIIFGNKATNNFASFGKSTWHALLVEDIGVNTDDKPNDSDSYGEGDSMPKLMDRSYDRNSRDDEDSDIGYDGNDDFSGVTSEKEAIETSEHSKRKFAKWDQLKADSVQRFQLVTGCPSDDTIA